MQTVDIFTIAAWDELEAITRVEGLTGEAVEPFMVTISSQFPDEYNLTAKQHRACLEIWRSIARESPEVVKRQIEIIFLDLYGLGPTGQHVEELEVSRQEEKGLTNCWYYMECAAKPATMKIICDESENFNIDDFESAFGGKATNIFYRFEVFREYSKAWINFMKEVGEKQCGMIVVHV